MERFNDLTLEIVLLALHVASNIVDYLDSPENSRLFWRTYCYDYKKQEISMHMIYLEMSTNALKLYFKHVLQIQKIQKLVRNARTRDTFSPKAVFDADYLALDLLALGHLRCNCIYVPSWVTMNRRRMHRQGELDVIAISSLRVPENNELGQKAVRQLHLVRGWPTRINGMEQANNSDTPLPQTQHPLIEMLWMLLKVLIVGI
ncbi:hypothetical protein BDQ12DRAFT_666396 [Crucibulum laeve]|uniref:Uncharacterized protein n=1 Tax=Crucibulum laeve TaxID=68775 RepID=A0A5C3M0F7_9AGAR|nr:hypothetical protein BDQ12DRAFT_666396 [Crucibulum laeve]